MEDPRETSPGSIMPAYPWLLSQKIDTNAIAPRIVALRRAGVPYPPGYEAGAITQLQSQAATIVTNLQSGMVKAPGDREIIALIAYLQRLGADIKNAPTPVPAPPAKTAANSVPTPNLN